MKNYKLLVFDWDGTLIDSISLIVEVIQSVAEEFNLPKLDEGKIRQNIGAHLDDIISAIFPDMPQDVLQERFQYHYTADKLGAKVFCGVVDTLNYLKQQGFVLAIATNKAREKLERDLVRNGLENVFTAIRCPEDGHAKPHPWMMLDLLDSLNCTPQQALMIGDTTYDMQLAQNAGVDALAVTYGSHDKRSLSVYCPVGYIDDISELQRVF